MLVPLEPPRRDLSFSNESDLQGAIKRAKPKVDKLKKALADVASIATDLKRDVATGLNFVEKVRQEFFASGQDPHLYREFERGLDFFGRLDDHVLNGLDARAKGTLEEIEKIKTYN